ncbi:hypothetical protein BCV70DRAFT_58796 [Testicularia cyperi]|uniref:Uncharacterized protein n=1 Tax=Testicularia cyperi TaxID=1882483 RepID=A0A317XV89_9BASI|nr:hypothetical protein BCV70DRAFT_58796 [Testicularia cyperi]
MNVIIWSLLPYVRSTASAPCDLRSCLLARSLDGGVRPRVLHSGLRVGCVRQRQSCESSGDSRASLFETVNCK